MGRGMYAYSVFCGSLAIARGGAGGLFGTRADGTGRYGADAGFADFSDGLGRHSVYMGVFCGVAATAVVLETRADYFDHVPYSR